MQMWCQPRAKLLAVMRLPAALPPTHTLWARAKHGGWGMRGDPSRWHRGVPGSALRSQGKGHLPVVQAPISSRRVQRGGAEWRQGRGKPKSEQQGWGPSALWKLGRMMGITHGAPHPIIQPTLGILRCAALRHGPERALPARPSPFTQHLSQGKALGPTGQGSMRGLVLRQEWAP